MAEDSTTAETASVPPASEAPVSEAPTSEAAATATAPPTVDAETKTDGEPPATAASTEADPPPPPPPADSEAPKEPDATTAADAAPPPSVKTEPPVSEPAVSEPVAASEAPAEPMIASSDAAPEAPPPEVQTAGQTGLGTGGSISPSSNKAAFGESKHIPSPVTSRRKSVGWARPAQTPLLGQRRRPSIASSTDGATIASQTDKKAVPNATAPGKTDTKPKSPKTTASDPAPHSSQSKSRAGHPPTGGVFGFGQIRHRKPVTPKPLGCGSGTGGESGGRTKGGPLI
ncbi:hypothetical protein IAT40_004048 [Kwoniella sp. CBS 6097]